MSEPAAFVILKNLQSALLAISVETGYHFGLAAMAVKLDPNCDIESLLAPDGPRPFVILQVKPDQRNYRPSMRMTQMLPLTVHWISDSVPTDDDSRMQTFFRGCADVEQAVALAFRLGRLGTKTTIVQQSFDTACDGSQVWAMSDLEVEIHRTYGAPNA